MIVKLLTEHHLECISLKGVHTCQNATLLEISCTGSKYLFSHFQMTDSCKDGKKFPLYLVKVTKPKLLLTCNFGLQIVYYPVISFN